jgi:hypothetical protein
VCSRRTRQARSLDHRAVPRRDPSRRITSESGSARFSSQAVGQVMTSAFRDRELNRTLVDCFDDALFPAQVRSTYDQPVGGSGDRLAEAVPHDPARIRPKLQCEDCGAPPESSAPVHKLSSAGERRHSSRRRAQISASSIPRSVIRPPAHSRARSTRVHSSSDTGPPRSTFAAAQTIDAALKTSVSVNRCCD